MAGVMGIGEGGGRREKGVLTPVGIVQDL